MTLSDASMPSAQERKRFKLIKKSIFPNYDYIVDDGASHRNRPSLYIVGISIFTRNNPNYTLYAGPDRSYPAVACAFVRAAARSSTLGLGDIINGPQNITWERLRQETLRGSEFSWGMSLPTGRVDLRWKRTSHHAVDGTILSVWSGRNWKLVSTNDNENVVAVFTGKLGISVRGTLQFNVDWGLGFEYMVLTTVAMLMYEEEQPGASGLERLTAAMILDSRLKVCRSR